MRRARSGLFSEDRGDFLLVDRSLLRANLPIPNLTRPIDEKRCWNPLHPAKRGGDAVIAHDERIVDAILLGEWLHDLGSALIQRNSHDHESVLAVLFLQRDV